MTTADVVMDRALALARAGETEDLAVRDLLECCGDNRVSVVMARRLILERSEPRSDGDAVRATELLNAVLVRLSES
jgi:hypothetical protein